jgi:hypothetical protein
MIGLSWFDGQDSKLSGMQHRFLEYNDGIVMDSVQKALDMLVPDWSKVYTREDRMSVISPSLDDDPTLFDFVVDAEEPEQAFISRNVLEFNEGKPAYVRKWESEFQKHYSKLTEFSREVVHP